MNTHLLSLCLSTTMAAASLPGQDRQGPGGYEVSPNQNAIQLMPELRAAPAPAPCRLTSTTSLQACACTASGAWSRRRSTSTSASLHQVEALGLVRAG